MSMVPAGSNMVDIGARLSLDHARFQTGMREAVASVGDLRRGIMSTRGAMQGLGAATALMGAGILRSLMMAGNGFTQFEANMRNIQSISIQAQRNLQAVASETIEVSVAVNKSAIDVSEGLYEIMSSGFDGAEALNVVEQAGYAASAGLTETMVAATGITAVLNAYGLEASDAADVSDILFETMNVGVGSFEELSVSLGDVVGLASTAGVSFDQVAAAMAAMSLTAIDFQTGATSLNRLIQGLIDPSEAMVSELSAMGFESGQVALQTIGLRGVMDNLRVSVGDNAQAWLNLLPDIRGVRAALALVANDGENYARVSGAITDENNRAGAAARAFEIQQRSLASTVERINVQFQAFMYEALMPMAGLLSTGARWFGNLLEVANKMPPELKAIITAVLALGAGLMILVGGALFLLPIAIGLAARAWIRYTIAQQGANIASNQFIMTQYRAVMANTAVAASLRGLTMAMNASKIAMAGTVVGLVALAAGLLQAGNRGDNVQERLYNIANLSMDDMIGNWREFSRIMDTVNPEFAQKGFESMLQTFEEAARSQPELAVMMLESARAANVNADQIAAMEEVYQRVITAQRDAASAADDVVVSWEASSGAVMQVTQEMADLLEDLSEAADDYMRTWGLLDNPYAEQEKGAERILDAQERLTKAEQDLADLQARSGRDSQRRTLDLRSAENDLVRARERSRDAENATEREAAAIGVLEAEMRLNDLREETPDHIRRIAEAEAEVVTAREALNEAEQEAVITGTQLLENMRLRAEAMANWSTNVAELRAIEGLPGQIVDEFVSMGPEGAQTIEAFLTLSPTQRQEFIENWQSATSDAVLASIGVLEENSGAMTGALRQLWDTSADPESFLADAATLTNPEQIATFLRTLDLTRPEVQGAIDEWFSPWQQRELGLDMEMAIDMAIGPDEEAMFQEFSRLSALDRTSFTFFIEMADPELMGRWLEWVEAGGRAGATPLPPGHPDFVGPVSPTQFEAFNQSNTVSPSNPRTMDKFAEGGIFHSPQVGLFAEAGAEAIIPLTRPGRAMALMQQSGLYSMVLRDFQSRSVSNDYSTHTRNEYRIDRVETADADQFIRQMESRRRSDALLGV